MELEKAHVELAKVRMEVLEREQECKEADVALERARSQHFQDLKVSLRHLHSEQHARKMQRQESERAAALHLEIKEQPVVVVGYKVQKLSASKAALWVRFTSPPESSRHTRVLLASSRAKSVQS